MQRESLMELKRIPQDVEALDNVKNMLKMHRFLNWAGFAGYGSRATCLMIYEKANVQIELKFSRYSTDHPEPLTHTEH